MNVANFDTSTILMMADLRSTQATTSAERLGTAHLLSVSKRFAGCSINLELSSPAGSKMN